MHTSGATQATLDIVALSRVVWRSRRREYRWEHDLRDALSEGLPMAAVAWAATENSANYEKAGGGRLS